MKQKYWFIFSIVLVIASLLRLPFLDTFPPGGQNALFMRIPSAIAGVISIGLFMLIVKKRSNDNVFSYVSGLVLTFMPWHIEQSRVYSQAMLGLTVVLAGTVLYHVFQKRTWQIICIIITCVVFRFSCPSFWFFSGTQVLPTAYGFVNNLFKLVSVEFLFFKNDSFWWGGLRTVGAMLVSTLPFFIIGIYEAVLKNKRNVWKWMLFMLSIWFVAAANPQFPEEREFFFITPFLSLILGFGVKKVIEQFAYPKIWIKALLSIYIIWLVYDHVVFIHWYTTHYPLRVRSEIPYEKRNF